MPRSRPSIRTRPDFGRLNAITREMSVLLPPPEAPTRAVVVPAGTWMLMFLSTGTPGLYSNQTPSKATSPRMSPTGTRVASSESSVASWRISRMRSSPAKASVIWVPMAAICTIGAAMRPVKKMYMKRSPTVIRPASTSPPPTRIISTPMPPTIAVANAPVPEMAVIEAATLRKMRWAPVAKT